MYSYIPFSPLARSLSPIPFPPMSTNNENDLLDNATYPPFVDVVNAQDDSWIPREIRSPSPSYLSQQFLEDVLETEKQRRENLRREQVFREGIRRVHDQLKEHIRNKKAEYEESLDYLLVPGDDIKMVVDKVFNVLDDLLWILRERV